MTPASKLDTLDESLLRNLLEELARDAAQFRFRVAPNPCVGAALIAGKKVVARGFHERWGGAHAEVQALAAARASTDPDAARFDTLVCTLEPCSTHGKTPACTGALLEAGVRRVVVGALDPNPRHRGKGLELLQQMGVEVELHSGASPLESVSPHFLRWTAVERVRRPRPWVIAKWAQTRTGQLSPPAGVGSGRWISGPESLAEVQEMRGRVDAILTGVGTVLADDPRLTVRPPGDRTTPPLRVVIDTELRTPPDARLFAPLENGDAAEEEAGGQVVILCRAGAPAKAHRALEAAGARIVGLRADAKDRVSLRAALEALSEAGVQRVLVEAGPTLLNALFDAGFLDQVAVYSGQVNGGHGPTLAERLVERNLLQPVRREVGDDQVLEAFVR
jgi:diaminohydroxyphosphoribosylaminopyrimidine deaminase/5-amino-6-(5-phosphoribosylamino)uracil reductase